MLLRIDTNNEKYVYYIVKQISFYDHRLDVFKLNTCEGNNIDTAKVVEFCLKKFNIPDRFMLYDSSTNNRGRGIGVSLKVKLRNCGRTISPDINYIVDRYSFHSLNLIIQ